MYRKLFRSSKPVGAVPGSATYHGERKTETVTITVCVYAEEKLEEFEAGTVEEALEHIEPGTNVWIDISGLHEADVVRKAGERLELHPLVLEDILNTDQRPKLEEYEHYLYLVLKSLTPEVSANSTDVEQLSLVLGEGWLLTFQERPGDAFAPVRDRLRGSKGRIRKWGIDYLCYALVDAVVDHYFAEMEKIGDRLERIELELMEQPGIETLHEIYVMKREMAFLRKIVWPLRDMVSSFERTESEIVKEETRHFIRDLYDHAIRLLEIVEVYRDGVSGMLDLYLSSNSNRMNDVMKVLTVMATIFIPLTFVAGIYGMNFDNMPELHWPWGYFAALGIMAGIGLGMVVFFKRRGWL